MDDALFVLRTPLRAWHESLLSARMDDIVAISTWGADLHTERPLPDGTPLFLELPLGGGAEASRAEIDAVAVGPTPAGSGFRIRFLQVDEAARVWIAAHVAAERALLNAGVASAEPSASRPPASEHADEVPAAARAEVEAIPPPKVGPRTATPAAHSPLPPPDVDARAARDGAAASVAAPSPRTPTPREQTAAFTAAPAGARVDATPLTASVHPAPWTVAVDTPPPFDVAAEGATAAQPLPTHAPVSSAAAEITNQWNIVDTDAAQPADARASTHSLVNAPTVDEVVESEDALTGSVPPPWAAEVAAPPERAPTPIFGSIAGSPGFDLPRTALNPVPVSASVELPALDDEHDAIKNTQRWVPAPAGPAMPGALFDQPASAFSPAVARPPTRAAAFTDDDGDAAVGAAVDASEHPDAAFDVDIDESAPARAPLFGAPGELLSNDDEMPAGGNAFELFHQTPVAAQAPPGDAAMLDDNMQTGKEPYPRALRTFTLEDAISDEVTGPAAISSPTVRVSGQPMALDGLPFGAVAVAEDSKPHDAAAFDPFGDAPGDAQGDVGSFDPFGASAGAAGHDDVVFNGGVDVAADAGGDASDGAQTPQAEEDEPMDLVDTELVDPGLGDISDVLGPRFGQAVPAAAPNAAPAVEPGRVSTAPFVPVVQLANPFATPAPSMMPALHPAPAAAGLARPAPDAPVDAPTGGGTRGRTSNDDPSQAPLPMGSPAPVVAPPLSAPAGIAVKPSGLVVSTDPFFPEWRAAAPSVAPTPAVGAVAAAAPPQQHRFDAPTLVPVAPGLPGLPVVPGPLPPATAGALLNNLSGSTTPPTPAEASFEDLLFGGVPTAPAVRQLDDAAQWSVTRAPSPPPEPAAPAALPLVVGAKLVQPAAPPAADAWAVAGLEDLKKP